MATGPRPRGRGARSSWPRAGCSQRHAPRPSRLPSALSFLLANALWQHLPLTPACLAAFAASALFAVVVVALVDVGGASDAGNLIFYLCFAALGAALARLALKAIDRMARRRP